MAKMRTLLWIDDDAGYPPHRHIDILEAEGYNVVKATTVDSACAAIEADRPALALIDVGMAAPKDMQGIHCASNSGGVWLAKWLRRNHIAVPFVGFSLDELGSTAEHDFFYRYGAGRGFYAKSELMKSERLIRYIKEALGSRRAIEDLRCFIVHGTDHGAKFELKAYLQDCLGIGDPIILDQQASGTRTIIEKFEFYADEVDVAMVLLMAEDRVAVGSEGTDGYLQSRPNVFFELGYFIRHFGRLSGRVFLLHDSKAKLPTDLSGIVYINISGGIAAAGEVIRRELAAVIERIYTRA